MASPVRTRTHPKDGGGFSSIFGWISRVAIQRRGTVFCVGLYFYVVCLFTLYRTVNLSGDSVSLNKHQLIKVGFVQDIDTVTGKVSQLSVLGELSEKLDAFNKHTEKFRDSIKEAFGNVHPEGFVHPARKVIEQAGFYNATGQSANKSDPYVNTVKPAINGIVIYSKFRTGSTFTGEFLRSHADVYYMFEPLHALNDTPKVNFLDKEVCLRFLRRILKCDFSEFPFLPKKHIKNILGVFGEGPKASVKIPAAEEACRKNKYVAAKVVRIENVEELEPLMREGVKVIHLLRDPRSVINSRKLIGGKDFKDLNNIRAYAETYCRNALEDLIYVNTSLTTKQGLIQQMYWKLRYEDLVKNQEKETRDMYKFIGIEPDKNVWKWLAEYNAAKEGKGGKKKIKEAMVGSRRNDPSSIPQKWKKGLTFDEVRVIQEVCEPMMKLVDYPLIHSATEMS